MKHITGSLVLTHYNKNNKWRIFIITDKDYNVACSGVPERLFTAENEERVCHSFRVDHAVSACKIGFFIGSKFIDLDGIYFSNQRRADDYKSFLGRNRILVNITDTFERILGKTFPYSNSNTVFVPNLFAGRKTKRRALCYSGI